MMLGTAQANTGDHHRAITARGRHEDRAMTAQSAQGRTTAAKTYVHTATVIET
jgi:hypothetical protein